MYSNKNTGVGVWGRGAKSSLRQPSLNLSNRLTLIKILQNNAISKRKRGGGWGEWGGGGGGRGAKISFTRAT